LAGVFLAETFLAGTFFAGVFFAGAVAALGASEWVGAGLVLRPGRAATACPATAPAVTMAAVTAQRGLVVCPGVQAPAFATTLTYPDQLVSGVENQVQLGCARDCLYLVTLDDSAGRPVVAARGALRGGAAPATVALPRAKLAAGTYRVDVRLVNQVNPAPLVRTESAPLAVQ